MWAWSRESSDRDGAHLGVSRGIAAAAEVGRAPYQRYNLNHAQTDSTSLLGTTHIFFPRRNVYDIPWIFCLGHKEGYRNSVLCRNTLPGSHRRTLLNQGKLWGFTKSLRLRWNFEMVQFSARDFYQDNMMMQHTEGKCHFL